MMVGRAGETAPEREHPMQHWWRTVERGARLISECEYCHAVDDMTDLDAQDIRFLTIRRNAEVCPGWEKFNKSLPMTRGMA